MSAETTGFLHSVQTLGAVDGPGVRFVAFMQGCPLRCACCHNPDTWAQVSVNASTDTCALRITPADLLARILRYKAFFGVNGGVTVSGGEPLLQPAFVTELFSLCRRAGIHTCLDTSGCRFDAATFALLAVTDLVLLDIKYTTEADYQAYVGCAYAAPLAFLEAAQTCKVPVWLRQVCVPGKNDDNANLLRLAALARAHPCVQRTQLLAFRKLCLAKYAALGIAFPFAEIPEASPGHVEALQKHLNAAI